MDTKLKADIAESAVITELLRRGFKVLIPYGDRLPYDIAIEEDGSLLRIQVKSAWISKERFVIDARQTKTNRRKMVRRHYTRNDFDFAIIYIQDLNDFFIIPVEEFTKYRGTITLIETEKTKAKFERIKIKKFRNRWDLLMGSLSGNS